MLSIAVVILNYNGKHLLEKFLPSVIQYSAEANIIVADNGSTDDSIIFLKDHYPQITIIEIGQNLGFCAGYNTALQQIKAQYYVLLNSDIEVTPNWLLPLYTLMEADKQIAACQPKIKSYHAKTYFEHAGAAGGFIDALGYPFCRGRVFDTLEKDEGQYNDVVEVFWATGACMFVRAALFHQLGGLDNNFFAHMEEIDFCWRAKNQGYKIFYCGQSEVFHIGGGTLHKSNPKKTFLNFRNGLLLLYKNLPAPKKYIIIFIRLILDGVAAIFFLINGFAKDFKAVFKAHIAFYTMVGKYQEKKKLPFSKHKQIISRSIIIDYFFLRRKFFKKIVAKEK